MASHPPDKQKNGRQAGYGTPGQSRSAKAASAPPSREGHAQRAAQDVAGLKDYVCGATTRSGRKMDTMANGVLMDSNWGIASAKEPLGLSIGL